MINRLFVVPTVPDARAEIRSQQIGRDVFLVDVYTIEAHFTPRQLKKIGGMLINPEVQQVYFNTFSPPKLFSRSFEIGFLSGVTDNVASTAREMIENELCMKFDEDEGVYTSQITYLSGNGTQKETEQIARNFMNPLIQRLGLGKEMSVPRVQLAGKASADPVDLDVPDEELLRIGKLGIKNADGTRRGPLALDLSSMKAIQAHFKTLRRNPTDVEIESLAQTWSEHCKHTIMNSPIDDIPEGLFRRYIKGATEFIRKKKGKKDFCVSVFSDNSGAIAFDRDWVITHKVETHNSPSALDPFGGAITGIVGVNRDCIGFGLGAKPIANTYGFCIGEPDDATLLFRDKERSRSLLPPRRILDGVVAGVNSGGNCSGIPTPLGFVYADSQYKGKPLVFVGTVGLIPRKKNGRCLYKKQARPGDYIVVVGGRVGLDGIHGATFSSEALSDGSPATAVQIGDPITQKKLSDALVKEARDVGLYHSITDNGAGGLSCSVAEMAKESGGCIVTLDKVPLKYPGLAPWQIWISESQERMTLAVPKMQWRKLKSLCHRRGVEATIIGTFTKSGRCVVRHNGNKVMDLSMEFLHNGLPRAHLHTVPLSLRSRQPAEKQSHVQMLSHPSIAGFSWISEQFDHEVQGTSITKPLQGKGRVNADAVVIRPILSQNRGIVLTHALYPEYGDSDPYRMAVAAIDSAVVIAVAAGADPEHIALLDNFCWCSARDPKRLWQLKEAARGCYDAATAYGTPFISGKDSMFNDFSGFDKNGNPVTISIPPTLLISAIGTIDNVQKSVTIDLKFPGDIIYVLDGTKNLCDTLARAIGSELVASAISVGRGGETVAIVKSALAGMLGVDVSLRSGRVIASVNPKKKRAFEHLMDSVKYKHIGVVTETPQVIIRSVQKNSLVNTTLEECMKAYHSTFSGF